MLHERWPATFPSGQGSDLAGTVERVGSGVDGFAAGDEVFGWVDTRSSQAEYAVVPATQLAAKPANVSWEVAGSLFVAGTTAVATVRAVAPKPGSGSPCPVPPVASARWPCSWPGRPVPR